MKILSQFLILFCVYLSVITASFAADIEFYQSDGGRYLIPASESTYPLPSFGFDSQGISSALNAYQTAQSYALEEEMQRRNLPQQTRIVIRNNFKPSSLAVVINDGDWMYNEMYGSNYMVRTQSGASAMREPAVLVGRNTPFLANQTLANESMAHEIGHAVMNALYKGQNLPKIQGQTHSYTSQTDPAFAFVEGWAEYFASVTSGDADIPRKFTTRSANGLKGSTKNTARLIFSSCSLNSVPRAQINL
jgi:hypothetical protein